MSNIMSISRLRMGTDGNGITTLIGFKGCPLSCKYCANKQCHDIWQPSAHYTPEELVEVIGKDELYFLMTGGGVTFGGGEPLLYSDYIHEVCRLMSREWKRTIETSLYAEWNHIQKIVEDIDFWYIDLKIIEDEVYKKYTGKSNSRVFHNLRKLLELVPTEKICLRLPVIPDYKSAEVRTQEILWISENIGEGVELDCFDYIKM